MRWLSVLLCFLFCGMPSFVSAEDTIYLEETVISGNQELPRVLYILPWQEMRTTHLPERGFAFQSDSVLTPIYPDEQRRELALRQALRNARAEATTQAISNGGNPD